MKKLTIIIISLTFLICSGFYAKRKLYDSKYSLEIARTEIQDLKENNKLKEGDIIFQTSLSRQSKAIQLATDSKYSHCGIIFKNKGKYYVYEAIQPVKQTPLDKWILRGKDGKFVIKRLVNGDRILTSDIIKKMKDIGQEFKGKNYDSTFEWSDENIYCSELVWKIYKRSTGLEIGELQKLREFDLTDSDVKKMMKERYGDIIPLDEIVISPASIFKSELLETVKSY
jgi:hypothetical protein